MMPLTELQNYRDHLEVHDPIRPVTKVNCRQVYEEIRQQL